MSVEELVRRLRSQDHLMQRDSFAALWVTASQAADKLEELAAENEWLQRRLELTQDTDSKMKLLLDQEDQIIRHEDALAEKDKEIAALREALEAMLEPYEGDPCRHDHHGYCQAHFLQEDCCVAKARATLARNAGGNDAE